MYFTIPLQLHPGGVGWVQRILQVIVELSCTQSSHSGVPWVIKFGNERNFGNDKIIYCLRSIFLRAPLIWLWLNFFRWDQKNDTWMLSEILRTLIVNIDYRVSIINKIILLWSVWHVVYNS